MFLKSVAFLVLLVTCSATKQTYQLQYELLPEHEKVTMNVEVDHKEKQIHFHVDGSDKFAEVETLEDYNTGYAATRVPSQEACYFRRLVKTLQEQVDFIKHYSGDPLQISTNAQVTAIPLEDSEEVGTNLAEFCGELPLYKMVQDSEEPPKEVSRFKNDQDLDERQVTVVFYYCVMLCFAPVCYYTYITIPTGTTVLFYWFWWG